MGVSPLFSRRSSHRGSGPATCGGAELVERLRHGLHRRLNLVAAPAGWGKTSCSPSGARVEDDVAFAWLTLDEDDNDPARFWAYVAAALRQRGRRCAAAFEARGRGARHAGRRRGAAAAAQRARRRRAGARPRARRLPRHPRAGDPRAACASCSPTCRVVSHLVIATRAEPPVDVSRLRARGELGEIAERPPALQRRGGRVRCSTTRSRSPSRPRTSSCLSASTEGWAAGLYLAGLSLRDRPRTGPAPRISATTATSSTTSATRCSRPRRPQARAFLLDTCVLDRFCAALCDAVRGEDSVEGSSWARSSGRTSSSSRSTSVREWFRYHHVFREVLRRELEDTARRSTSPSCTPAPARGSPARATSRPPSPTCSRRAREAAAADLIAASWNACAADAAEARR